MGVLLGPSALKLLLTILVFQKCGILVRVSAVPLSSFFPYGTENGDTLAWKSDDGSSHVILSSPIGFPFFNQVYNQLWVNYNGGISFKRAIAQYTPVCAAIDETSTMIAPFWADVDNRNGGDILFRETSNRTLLSKAVNEIQAGFPELWGMESASLFIATWSNVSYYGKQQRVCGDKRNTFQVILSTDGVYSFAIFYYHELTWTTGSGSGGDRCGLGGTSAKAGFDVGDGATFFTVPGSCTPQVLDIAQQSNVNSPGKWVFRVDNTFQPSGCDSDKYREEKLQLSPSFVGTFGHVPLTITGPCFHTALRATCRFNDERFNGTHMLPSPTNVTAVLNSNSNESVAICQVPFLYSNSRITVDLFVLQDNGDREEIQYTGFLYTMQMEGDVSVEFGTQEDSQGKIPTTLTWNPKFFKEDGHDAQDQDDPVRLQVILLEYNNTKHSWEANGVVLKNVINSGNIIFGLEPQGLPEVMAFQIKPNGSNNSTFLKRSKRDLSSVRNRMRSRFTSIKIGFFKNVAGRCDRWYESDPGSPMDIEACPPLLSQAQSDARFEDDGLWPFLLEFFHPGAIKSYRQRVASPSGAGQQCVYNGEGRIMVGPPGGGTADLSGPDGVSGFVQHVYNDIRPWVMCCKLNTKDQCRKYYEKRPSDSGESYVPPRPGGGSGDPHITTFDHLTYSFNGVGEFWMVKSSGSTLDFSMQARMEQYISPDSGPTNASIFTAFVMSDGQNRIQVQYSRQRGLDLFLNGEIIDSGFPSSNSNAPLRRVTVSARTANIDIEKSPMTGGALSALISFTSGFSFNVTLVQDQESLSLLASSSQQNKGKTVGLLGYFDGSPENDLRVEHENGSVWTIPSDSSLEKIHHDFGLHWMLKEEDSLFIYPKGRDYNAYSRPEFIPNFQRPNLSALPENILELCAGSQNCLFDYAVTGSENFAKGTKEQAAVLNKTVSALEKEVEMCSSIQRLENGFVTTTNFFQGSKVNFACNAGYKLNGVLDQVTCIKDAGSGGSELKWSGEIPTCVENDGNGGGASPGFYTSLSLALFLSCGILRFI